jgi:hypothetical protein
MLFDVLRYGVKDGEFASQYISMSGSQSPAKEDRNNRIGRFHKQQCAVVLNSGEVLGGVEVYTRMPQ